MVEQVRSLLEGALQLDSALLYLLMYGGGVLASLTPCTYPVLPLTIGYLGSRAGGDRRAVFLLGVSLVTGLATVYALMGVIVATVGGTFGAITGNGAIMYAIAMYYLLMGLFLLDLFPIPAPRFFTALQIRSASQRGVLGAFVLGGVSGLIVGPCTGPILAVALGAIALTLTDATGIGYLLQIARGGAMLFLFGLGQGTLILLAALFSGFLMRLPKGGLWMERLKKGFALVVIAASSLLFVFVGQNTDFPSLTRLLAGGGTAPAPSVQTEAPQDAPARRPIGQGADLAPDFTLPSLAAGEVTLSRLRGDRGVVLVFFATWCVNCVKEIPEIKRFAATARRRDVIVYAINYKQSPEVVERFRQSMEIDYEILLDSDGTVTTDAFGVKGIPHIVGINARGEIVYRGVDLPEDQGAFIADLRQGLQGL